MKQLIGLFNFYTNQNTGDHPSILIFGLFISKMGFLHQARRFYAYLLKTLPPDYPDWGVLHNNLGEVLRKLNCFNLAHYHFEQALKHSTDTISIYHPFWAILHSNIAVLELTYERPTLALKNYRCALLIINRLSTNGGSEKTYLQEALATIYHGMAAAYHRLNKFQQAVQLYEKALVIELNVLPHDHPTLMESYHGLGEANILLNRLAKALRNFEESLRIAQKNLLTKDWRFVTVHINIAVLTFYTEKNTSKTLLYCSHVLQLLDQSTFFLTIYNRLDVYKTLATLYLELGLEHLALEMWEQFIKTAKDSLVTESNTENFSDILPQAKTLVSSERKADQGLGCMILSHHKNLANPSLSHLETITGCETADRWRAMGYVELAIRYYTWLLENFPNSDEPQFEKLHKSRLHNNLAACYQDLGDAQAALHHYRLSLDILAPDEKHKSMQPAILHYNIALIYINLKEFDEAQTHLHKSLHNYLNSSDNKNSVLDVKIYIAFAQVYERLSEWQMARDYYQRVIDQMKQDVPDHPSIIKFQKRMEYIIDKINEST